VNTYDKIYAALTPSGYPVQEQGSYGPGETLPDSFITYQIIDQPDIRHADNVPHAMMSLVRLVVYSTDPAVVQSADQLLRALLIPGGFIRSGGRGLPFDSDTGHYAYTNDYKLYEEV
jgi:hypothetical protein